MYFDLVYSNKYYTMISGHAIRLLRLIKAEKVSSSLFPEVVVVEPLVWMQAYHPFQLGHVLL